MLEHGGGSSAAREAVGETAQTSQTARTYAGPFQPAPLPQVPPIGSEPENGRPMPTDKKHRWGMVIDTDRCTGCQACVVACQAENNLPINEEEKFLQHRPKEWIRIERYWEGEYPNVKARFLPVLCQHCGDAPCEPVCPVYATYHNPDGLNAQVYNRCIGTRYCGNNCPYSVRFFNFDHPRWPEPLPSQLNPDVTVRTAGVIEKCTFCVQRINRAERTAREEGRDLADGEVQTACAQACPTDAIIFGDWNNPQSLINRLAADRRRYRLLEEKGTDPSIVYLARVDPLASVGDELPVEAEAKKGEPELKTSAAVAAPTPTATAGAGGR